MDAIRSKDYRVGFRISFWDLERLAQLLGGEELVTCVAIEMTDGSSRVLEHVGEFKDVDNTPGRRIRAVSLESAPPAFFFSEDSPPRLALVTVRDGAADTVRYHVSGSPRVVDRLTRELDDWVTSIRPWYSSLAVMDRSRFFVASVATVGALAFLVLALYLTLGGTTVVAKALTPGFLLRFAAAGGLLTVAAGAALLNVRRGRFLPFAEFHVGQGERSTERLARQRRWLIRAAIVAAVVAVSGSIAGAFLA